MLLLRTHNNNIPTRTHTHKKRAIASTAGGVTAAAGSGNAVITKYK